jgi:hypothetical protein
VNSAADQRRKRNRAGTATCISSGSVMSSTTR